MPNIFEIETTHQLIQRIHQLNPDTRALWGKMTVNQMLAHCIVPYEMALTDKYPPMGTVMKFIATLFAKNQVIGDKPYPRSSRTAPEFIIVDQPDFNEKKEELIKFIQTVYDKGITHFDGKASRSFGNLSSQEWSNLFYKHLDHHLTQFGV
jgi:hypothetical protein